MARKKRKEDGTETGEPVLPEVRDDLGRNQEGVEGGETQGGVVDRVLQPVKGKPGRKKKIDPERESREAGIILDLLHKFIAAEPPPEDQQTLNTGTAAGYAEEYNIALSRYILHIRAAVGGAWFLVTAIRGGIRRLRAASVDRRPNGEWEDLQNGKGFTEEE